MFILIFVRKVELLQWGASALRLLLLTLLLWLAAAIAVCAGRACCGSRCNKGNGWVNFMLDVWTQSR